jgi:hypothetical protein
MRMKRRRKRKASEMFLRIMMKRSQLRSIMR